MSVRIAELPDDPRWLVVDVDDDDDFCRFNTLDEAERVASLVNTGAETLRDATETVCPGVFP